MRHTPSYERGLRSSALLAGVALLTAIAIPGARMSAASAPSASEAPAVRPELSAAAAESVRRISAMLEAGEWSAARQASERWRDDAVAGSYERALANLHLAQACLSGADRSGDAYSTAIAALEAVMLSGYWSSEQTLAWRNTLARLCLIEGRLEEARLHIDWWLEHATTPTPDGYVVAATVGKARESTCADRDSSSKHRSVAERRKRPATNGCRSGGQRRSGCCSRSRRARPSSRCEFGDRLEREHR